MSRLITHLALLVATTATTTITTTITTGESDQCASHPELPVFPEGSLYGHYGCCDAEVLRFNPPQVPQGCVVRQLIMEKKRSVGGEDLTRNADLLFHASNYIMASAWKEAISEEVSGSVSGVMLYFFTHRIDWDEGEI